MLKILARLVDRMPLGKPNEAVPAAMAGKPWFVRYSNTIIFVIGYSLLVLYTEAVSYYLNPVPAIQDLQAVNVKIIQSRSIYPQFVAQKPDGSRLSMEWPGRVQTVHKGGAYGPASSSQYESLIGCEVTAKGVNLSWVAGNHFRIWELDCPAKNIRFNYSTVVAYSSRDIKSAKESIFLFAIPLFLLGTFALFFYEKRSNL